MRENRSGQTTRYVNSKSGKFQEGNEYVVDYLQKINRLINEK